MQSATIKRMPSLFVGHGNPMNAIEDNRWSRAFEALGGTLPTPAAYLCISAHWYGPGVYLTGNDRPETIHDFGGFPRELFQAQYSAPGSAELASTLSSQLAKYGAQVTLSWGLDHGTWTVMKFLRPTADVPVLQLSIDQRLSAAQHLELGRAIADLRDESIMILGSGNVTHNLPDAISHFGLPDAPPPAWAAQFDADVARAALQHDSEFLVQLASKPEFRTSHPTPDHYLPLLYTVGAATEEDTVSFPVTGFDLGSLSMRAIQYG